MECPFEDQSSHYGQEGDKFAYLSMRDRIELGRRQVQQSQWGSKYALNGDRDMKEELASMASKLEELELRDVQPHVMPCSRCDSFEHVVGKCPTIPTMREMLGYQSSYNSSWNNHPNPTSLPQPQPQPQPSMSTSSMEQAIVKLSKVVEDFVGEQRKINSHLNEKIDNLESSMKGIYIDLSLRIEKLQDSIEKLTILDTARGKRKPPP